MSISEAVDFSRSHGQIGHASAASAEEALEALLEEVSEGEECDYVKNGDVLEFWAWDADDDDMDMTMRVHVNIG